jgi:hypothetical protein
VAGYELYYSCAKDAPQFESHSRIIAESFRVIVPNPASAATR